MCLFSDAERPLKPFSAGCKSAFGTSRPSFGSNLTPPTIFDITGILLTLGSANGGELLVVAAGSSLLSRPGPALEFRQPPINHRPGRRAGQKRSLDVTFLHQAYLLVKVRGASAALHGALQSFNRAIQAVTFGSE